MPASCPRSTRCELARRAVARQRRRERHLDGEVRAARRRSSADRPCGRARGRCVPRSTARARARAQPWRPGRAGGTRWKITRFFDAGMPRPVSYTSMRSLPPRAGSRPARGPCGVYLMALETRFCSSRRSRRRSERTAQRARHERELESLLARQRREFDLELAQQLVDAEGRELRLQGAGVEPRDVEQRAQDLLDRLQRGVDIADQAAVLAVALPLDQDGDVEPRRVERLQDVVARGREEPGLGDVGLVGLRLGAARARR